MSRPTGKVAVITGGGTGLGEAIAYRMAEKGAAIAILDRDERGQEVAEKLVADGSKATFRLVDVTSEEQVSSSFASVAEELGSITVLVNNAGIEGVNKPTDQLDLADWDKIMAVNSTAVFLCTKHVIAHMRAAGTGSIINISSIYGILGGADIPSYHASKGAVRVMSKKDSLAYAPENIRVNSIHPGFIFTDMVHRYASEAGLSEADARGALDPAHPLGGTGAPDDIAWACGTSLPTRPGGSPVPSWSSTATPPARRRQP